MFPYGNKNKVTAKLWLSVALLVIVSSATYANSLYGDFVWDDKTLFVENYDLWQWDNLKRLLTSQDNLFNDTYTGFYRPLPNLSFLLDRYIWGQDPFGYHLTNVMLQVVCTVLVFLIIYQMASGIWPAFLGALFFAVHPVHTEVVAWINGRNNLISSLFYLASFSFYIRYRMRGGSGMFAWSLVAFVLSLLSKEYALTMPFVLILYECCFHSESLSVRKYKKLGLLVGPFLLLIGGYLMVRSLVLPYQGATDLQLDSLDMRLLTVPKIVLSYMWILVFPFQLSAWRHVDPVDRFLSSEFFVYGLLLLALLFAWKQTFRKSKPAFFALGWTLITCLPVLNIIPVSATGRLMAERYLYLPSVGFCMLFGWPVLQWLRSRLDWSSRRVKAGAVATLLIVVEIYGFKTFQRNLIWRSDLMLWEDTVEKSPRHFLPYANAAIELEAVGRLEEAEKRIQRAIQLNPADETLHFIHAHILFEKGVLTESLDAVNKTLERDPKHVDANILKKAVTEAIRKDQKQD
jgi:hypothetical protein